MPIYLFWGEDDFAIAQAVNRLRQSVLDPNWSQFNYDQVEGDSSEATIAALNQVMTPPFGTGGRLVWLTDTDLAQQCSETELSELERTLPKIPANSHLLLTTTKKLDKRLKSTKLLQKYAQIEEFSLVPPWKTEAIAKRVQQEAQTMGVKLTAAAVQLLAESVGNNPRQLNNELAKLRLYGYDSTKPLDREGVSALVNANTQNSLQLAAAIRKGDAAQALQLVNELINRNEPALKITATLVGQFRTWAIVKLMVEKGANNQAIAQGAEVGNPKRVYFLRKEVNGLSGSQLLGALPILLELELKLKRGAQPLETLQTQVIELCHLFQTAPV